MKTLEMEKLNLTELTVEERKKTSGGGLWELIAVMWALTPEDGGSFWVNLGGGAWGGITWQ
jgi:hypothetical protein